MLSARIQVEYIYSACCFPHVFFFSSRRRHTRLTCDWSSDVCSSDLACPRCDRRYASQPRCGVGRDRLAAGAGARARIPLRQPLPRRPQRARLAALWHLPRRHHPAGRRAARRRGRGGRARRVRSQAALLRIRRCRRRPCRRASRQCPRPRFPARPRALGRGDEPDHGSAPRLRPAGHARRDRPPADCAADARDRPLGRVCLGRYLARARVRLLLDLPGRLLRHLTFIRALRPRAHGTRPGPSPSERTACAGGSLMFAHEFMRNALVAGTFVGLACGLVGYFVVLRAQVFAGDALSHIAFTGGLAAAVLGLDILAGVFATTILGGIVIGLLGDKARADDVAIGSFFAWSLGLGVLFLTIFTTQKSAGNGTAGVRVLFGSIFGLSRSDVRTSVVLSLLACALLLGIARPLLFASLDDAVAAARGVPVRLLGLGFLALLGLVAAQATQAVGALLLLGLLSAPAGAAHRLTATPYRGLLLSAVFAVASIWIGLTLSYVFPTLPPSSMIIAAAVGIYVLALPARVT